MHKPSYYRSLATVGWAIYRSLNSCASLSLILFAVVFQSVGLPATRNVSEGILVPGPGVPPVLEFACCEHGVEQMQRLFANPGLITLLQDLHASVAIAILDFSPQRTDLVRRLDAAGVPVVAWIVLPKEQGYYLTADSEPEAAARISNFEQWSSDQGLRWSAVGLDIEPSVVQLAQLRGHPWRLVTTLVGRGLEGGRVAHARNAYSTLIDELRSRGFPVQIYQLPYIAAERRMHSTLPDRLLGTVDIRGDQDYLMLYTSAARPIGVGMIWSLGPMAQAIAIGSTDGDAAPGSGSGPLDWTEFSRDLILASHFTRQIGVYDLEGCVRQGFLAKLLTMDWSQSVVIPAASVQRAARLAFLVRSMLWIGSNFPYLVSGAFLLIFWIGWRRIHQKRPGTQV